MTEARNTAGLIMAIIVTVLATGVLPAGAAVPLDERNALIAVYDTTGGASWSNRAGWRNLDDTGFADPGTECTWYGVTCDATEAHVVGLDLHGNGLSGTIPTGLAPLAALETLHLNDNWSLGGSIPTELGSLATLKQLYLGSTVLEGSIPTQLGSLAALEQLSLANAYNVSGAIPTELGSLGNLQILDLYGVYQLSGSIPTQLGSLGNLRELNLNAGYGGTLTGGIPTQLGSLPKLESLEIVGHPVGGPIPTELGQLDLLTMLNLQSCALTGPVPTELSQLGAIQQLYLGSNQLTGPIPTELGGLASLEDLFLNQNQLTGPVPTVLGGLTSLQQLYLDNNQLTGPIPTELGGLSAMQGLSLGSNQLAGSIPTQLGTLTSLTVLGLADNELTGGIPPFLGSLPLLDTLILSNNPLGGSIPTELGNLSHLWTLDLCGDQLTGSVPTQLGSALTLRYFRLCSNQLTGSIPTQLGALTHVWNLDLSGNQLSGGIPTQLGAMVSLDYLQLQQNQLTGDIPTELGGLPSLYYLYLYQNQLSGSIPSELGSLPDLRVLALSANQLTGPIPTELGAIPQLWELSADGNHLTGGIPTELGSASTLRWLLLENNSLGGPIPSQLGGLQNLYGLRLQGNMLTGEVPTELGTITSLWNGNSDFQYNALHTSDPTLLAFLNSKQAGGSWELTQTVAVTGVAVGSPTQSTAHVSWTPIEYSADGGGYDLLCGTVPGGPKVACGGAASKLDGEATATGLAPSTTYYVAVQSRTAPHPSNQNTVLSELSGEVEVRTLAAMVPDGLLVDSYGTGLESNLNGILEPGERAVVAPRWTNQSAEERAVDGAATTFTGPSGVGYALWDGVASYGVVGAGVTVDCVEATGNGYVAEVMTDFGRPAAHWDATFEETLSNGDSATWTLHVGASFLDVAVSHSQYRNIETLLHSGVTGGCTTTTYCPSKKVNRAQMGIFVARSMNGGDDGAVPANGTIAGKGDYACGLGGTSRFADVAATASYCRHVHYMAAQGVTQGCGDGSSYCPSSDVSRSAMATFIARAVAGGDAGVPVAYVDAETGFGYDCTPATADLHFTDVSASTTGSCRYIHYLWARGMVDGCVASPPQFCPSSKVNRAAMAKFLVNGFGFTLPGA